MHKASDGPQDQPAAPRYFTTSSVRTILHNQFYAGFVKHNDEQLPGLHEAWVSKETFDKVQPHGQDETGQRGEHEPDPHTVR